MGPTLEVLAYFSATKASRLLSVLGRKGQNFLSKKRQHILQTCVPSVFDAKMTELEPITHLNQTISVLKIAHIRQSIFVVGYITGLIELVDFDTPEAQPLASFQVPHVEVVEGGDQRLAILVDIDVHSKSEEKIMLCFSEGVIGHLNMNTLHFELIEGFTEW